jgi:peptidyl-prolyl cis-trans isomerase D
MWCPQPELIDVPLSRQEVESYYRQHLADYASPEQFRARHILVKPSGVGEDADRTARQRAEQLLQRIRAGEDFGDLARRVTDDDKTRDDAGDLGYRAAGELAPELQKVAFALKVGQVSDVFRAPDGYHIVQLIEHIPERAEPLAWVYTAVGTDAAIKKAQVIARGQADSLAQVIRDPAQAREVADRLHLEIGQYRHVPGDRGYPPEQIRMVERLERMKPGEMYPGTEFFLGLGAAVMWVDSIAPPHLQPWEQGSNSGLIEYRMRLSEGAIAAKQAELDSLLHAGWSFDSLGALWGGLKHDDHYTRHEGLPGIGSNTQIDSLAFGASGSPPLADGALSGWLKLREAALRVRVNRRHAPGPAEIENEIGQLRGIVIEYRLQDQLKSMRERYPVRIVETTLRSVALPPLPPMPEL